MICAPLHPRPVERITPLDIAVILRSLRPGTAKKTQSALRALFTYAMVEMAHRGVHFPNPVSADLLKAVGYVTASQPRPAMRPSTSGEYPSSCDVLDAIDTPTARCLRFIALTASRSGAARLMRFDQIDFDARVWRCPAEQMKDFASSFRSLRRPTRRRRARSHRQARTLALRLLRDDGEPINDMTLITLTRALRREHDDWRDPDSGKPFVIHGLRSSFRGWAQFHRLDREIAELVLGHRVYGQVERAYARGDLLDERRRMLDGWADHCTGQRADVIAFETRLMR